MRTPDPGHGRDRGPQLTRLGPAPASRRSVLRGHRPVTSGPRAHTLTDGLRIKRIPRRGRLHKAGVRGRRTPCGWWRTDLCVGGAPGQYWGGEHTQSARPRGRCTLIPEASGPCWLCRRAAPGAGASGPEVLKTRAEGTANRGRRRGAEGLWAVWVLLCVVFPVGGLPSQSPVGVSPKPDYTKGERPRGARGRRAGRTAEDPAHAALGPAGGPAWACAWGWEGWRGQASSRRTGGWARSL